MAVIIRLQNLPLSADSMDIRDFFKGLKIPEGGVHIVGGEHGDAFIGFATDEDARQAMSLNNKKVKESRIKLLLSSRTEMQNVILAARERQAKLLAEALNKVEKTTNEVRDGSKNSNSPTRSSSKQASSSSSHQRKKSRSRSPLPRDDKDPRSNNISSRYNTGSRAVPSRSRSREKYVNGSNSSSFRRDTSRDSKNLARNFPNSSPSTKSPLASYVTSSAAMGTTEIMPVGGSYKTTATTDYYLTMPPPNVALNPHQMGQQYYTSRNMMDVNEGSSSYAHQSALGIGMTSNSHFGQLSQISTDNSNIMNQNGTLAVAMRQGIIPNHLPFLNQAETAVYPHNIAVPPPQQQQNFYNNNNTQSVQQSFPFSNSSAQNMVGMNNNAPAAWGGNNPLVPTNPYNTAFNNNNISNNLSLQQQQIPNTYNNNNNTNTYQYIEVRNLPPSYNVSEIINFFSDVTPLKIQDMCPVMGNLNRLLIRVSTNSAYQGFLAKNGARYLGFKNRLEVIPASIQNWISNAGPSSVATSSQFTPPNPNNTFNSSLANNNNNNINVLNHQQQQQFSTMMNPMVLNNFNTYPAVMAETPNMNNIVPQPSYQLKDEGWCAKLSNLSYGIESRDIQQFFRDFQILNLHIEQREDGRLTGNAFIEFGNEECYQKALKLHRTRMSGRHIFIEHMTKAQVIERVRDNVKLMSTTTNSSSNNNKHSSGRMSRNNNNVKDSSDRRRDRGSGEDRPPIHNRAEFNNSQTLTTPIPPTNFMANTAGPTTISAIHINSLPQNTRVSDIIAHLSRYNFNPKEIHILRKNGIPVGQAFIEFFNPDEVTRSFAVLNGSCLSPDTAPIRVQAALNSVEIKSYIASQFDPINWLDEALPSQHPFNATANHLANNGGPQNFGAPTPNAAAAAAAMLQSFMRPPLNNPMMNVGGAATPSNVLRSGPGGTFRTSQTTNFYPPKRTFIRLIIKQLPYDITADEVIELCKPFGCVASSLQMPHSSSGEPLGQAIIGFPDQIRAQEAKDKLDNTSYKANTISVTFQ